MAGQGTQLTRQEVISMTRGIEFGPGKTMNGSSSPNATNSEMGVKVPTGKMGK